MRSKEMDAEIGRAYVERKKVIQKIGCLTERIRRIGRAAIQLADNPYFKEAREIMEEAPDIRADYEALLVAKTRLAELNEMLRD